MILLCWSVSTSRTKLEQIRPGWCESDPLLWDKCCGLHFHGQMNEPEVLYPYGNSDMTRQYQLLCIGEKMNVFVSKRVNTDGYGLSRCGKVRQRREGRYLMLVKVPGS